jgi:hypothetical protein
MKLPHDPQIQEAYANLLLEDRMVFEHAYAVRSKGIGATYLAWMVGSHHAYLGRWNVQFAYWFTAGGLVLWALADLFRIPGLVNEHNRAVALRALAPLAQRSKAVEVFEPLQPAPNPVQSHRVQSHPVQSTSSTQIVTSTQTMVLEPVPTNQHAVIEFVF